MATIPALRTNMFNVQPPTSLGVFNTTNSQSLSMYPGSLQALAPLFSQSFQQQQSDYKQAVQSFSSSWKELNSAAKSVTSDSFAQKAVTSGSAAVSGTAKKSATDASYSVGVTQLATTQRNTGTSFSGSAYGALSSGSHSFGIKVGSGAEKQLSVNVLATDTNKQTLDKFAGSINAAKLDVTASVQTDKQGKNFLSLESKTTGAAQTFSLRDISGSAVAGLGVGNTAQQAADAKYSINGTAYSSASNKVTTDNGNVTLQLNAVTADNKGNLNAATVKVGKDSGAVVKATQNLVDAYNKTLDTMGQGDLTRRGQHLLDRLGNSVSQGNQSALANIGITQDKATGELKLDQTKLSAALSKNPAQVENALSGSGGLSGRLESVSKQAMNTAANQYLQAPQYMDWKTYDSQAQQSNLQMLLGNSTGGLNGAQGLFMDMRI